MKFAFIFIFCCLQGVIVKSQTQDSLEARKYIDSLYLSIQLNNVDSADFFYQKANYYFKNKDDLRLFTVEHIRLSNSLYNIEPYLLLQCNFISNGLDSLWRTPKDSNEYEIIIDYFISIAYFYGQHLSDIQKKISILKKVESIYLDSLKYSDIKLAFWVYNQLGNGYNRLGEQKKALIYFEKADSIAVVSDRPYYAASIKSNTGIAYRNQSMYKKAKAKYKEGLRLNISDFSLYTILLENLAEAYCDLGQLDSCRIINKKLEQENKLNRYKHPEVYNGNIPYIHKNNARYFRKMGMFKKAKNHYQLYIDEENSLTLRERALGNYELGLLNIEIDNYQEAISNFDASLIVLFDNHPDSFSIASEEGLTSGNIHVRVRYEKSRATYLGQKGNYLQKSLLEIDRAIQLDHALLFNSLEFESSRLVALKRRRSLIDHAVKVCYELFEKTQDESYNLKALEYSELSRANLLYVERSRMIEDQPDLPLAERISLLKDNISTLRNDIFLANQRGSTSELPDLEWALKEVHEDLNNCYLGNSNDANSTSLEERIKRIPKDQAIIEYYLSSEDNRLTIFIITQDKVKTLRKTLKIDLNKSISKIYYYLDKVGKLNDELSLNAYKSEAFELYNLLFSDVHLNLRDRDIKRIKICPDGPLNNLSFDMLLMEKSDSIHYFSQLPFVLKEYTISHIHSINFYFDFQDNQDNNSNPNNFVTFVPDYSFTNSLTPKRGDSEVFNILPGAKKESKIAHELFCGKSYVGHEATKTNFMNHASSYTNILLSMHASLDTSDSNFSSLVFHDEPNEIDRMLFAHEISALDFDADLLVLSACNTGKGKYYSGEGAMSLSRRFAQQGVRATVMGLWSLPDEETADILPSFYKYIASGYEKDRALQMAKVDYIEKYPLRASPLFWAGLSISGNMEPLTFQDEFPVIWFVSLASIIFVLIFIFLKKKSTRR